ncbi:MAG TPA: class I SAM-dependent methyltransferase [Candidatus Elarobacter sp.]|nr:class I SAM-dependent methyltransferase [Candidatus Elarobacter sp.]
MTFQDLFSQRAAAYAAFRPTYPRDLFAFIAELAPDRHRAWDCATGSGQAAISLAEYFQHVAATDASVAQLRHARSHRRVTYHAALADASALRDGSADLVTIAQALHWLDLDAFYAEVRRVLVPRGVLAVWSYGDPVLPGHPKANRILQRFNHETVGPYWPTERHQVGEGYRTYPFPFDEVAAPEMTLEAEWTLAQLAGYVRSWSATSRYVQQHEFDPVDALEREWRTVWDNEAQPIRVRWPLVMRVGRRA